MPTLMSSNGRKRNGGDFNALDFFSGCGLVTEALKPWFTTLWANDICPKKCAVYVANFGGDHLVQGSITKVDGSEIPSADLAWASFPCQDLSLAGNMDGLSNGSRSALYWEWVRILEEMNERRRPPVLCAENVVGFLVADEGKQFRSAYLALRKLGYLAGALVIDAIHFLPQSRPRSFLVAVKEGTPFERETLTAQEPHPLYHGKAVLTAWKTADDPEWLWWILPQPPRRNLQSGLRPIIITLRDKVEGTTLLAENAGVRDRVEVYAAETFISTNVNELAKFEGARLKTTTRDLVKRYNEIITNVENDPSLKIEER